MTATTNPWAVWLPMPSFELALGLWFPMKGGAAPAQRGEA